MKIQETMTLEIIIQNVSETTDIPSESLMQNWVISTLESISFKTENEMEMTIRIVDEEEGRELNNNWRNKNNATNVLSFPYMNDETKENNPLLGDIVVCAPVLQQEAQVQNKQEESHWAHLIIHGSLHLLGYDHIESAEAEKMESLERSILQNLGYPDPYQEDKH